MTNVLLSPESTGRKVCKDCKLEKPLSEYYSRRKKTGGKLFYDTRCIDCHRGYNAKRNKIKRDSRPKIVIEDLSGEVWVPVVGYEGKYLVSNLARVKSVDRWKYKEIVSKEVFIEGKLLGQCVCGNGYHQVTLYGATQYDKHPKPVYHIVFWSFNKDVEKIPGYEIDHINNDKLNSKLYNLQYIKGRHNSSKRSMNLRKTSRFTGVSWSRKSNKWQTHIRHLSKSYFLGFYVDEFEAATQYQKALKEIETGTFEKALPAAIH